MANVDLTKYGITGTTEIVHNPSYETLFEEETKAGLEGYEVGKETELGAVNVKTGIIYSHTSAVRISGKELPGSLLLRMVNHLMRVSLLNNHTTIHEDHLVCNITRKSHLMCHNNHCGILLRK